MAGKILDYHNGVVLSTHAFAALATENFGLRKSATQL
jgi:hypothetical protein